MNDPENPYRLHPAIPVGPHDLSDEEIAGIAGGTSEAPVEDLLDLLQSISFYQNIIRTL